MTSLREPPRHSQPRATRRAPAAARYRWQWLTDRLRWLVHRWQSLNRRQQLLAVCATVALTVSVGIYLASNNNGTSPGDAASSSAGSAKPIIKQFTPAHRSSSSDTPEAAIAAMRLPPGLAVSLREWNAGRGGAALVQVSADLNSAIQSAGNKRFVLMRPACSSLATAVTAAKAAPPIPGVSLQRSYIKALGTARSAATICLDAISEHAYGDDGVETHESPALVSQSVTELTAGAQELYPVTLEIEVARHR
jgi:hypothetical protein